MLFGGLASISKHFFKKDKLKNRLKNTGLKKRNRKKLTPIDKAEAIRKPVKEKKIKSVSLK